MIGRVETRPLIDDDLIRRLVDRQFPQWAHLGLRPVEPAGSDHAIHRLGDELSVRLPRHSGAVGQAAKDLVWLPRLAPHLPLAVPVPVAVGEPDLGYPWQWGVARWLDGEVATLSDSVEVARQVADFLRALQAVEDVDLPGNRPLAVRDRATRAAIADVAGVFDAGALTAVWSAALDAPGWDRPPVVFHGDFHVGNLLTDGQRLTAVIDFGGLGRGDPACDLTVAFTLMTARARAAFRDALGVDDATWARGRGWALTTGLNAYVSYAATHPRIAAATTRQIHAALDG